MSSVPRRDPLQKEGVELVAYEQDLPPGKPCLIVRASGGFVGQPTQGPHEGAPHQPRS